MWAKYFITKKRDKDKELPSVEPIKLSKDN